MNNWAKHISRAALVAAGAVVIGSGLGSAGALADVTDGTGSVGGGNQLNVPVSVPANVSGNALSVLGTSKAHSVGGAHVTNVDQSGSMTTSGKGSVLGGNQLKAPISAPINLCGNAVAVAGLSKAHCHGSATVTNSGGGAEMKTSGKGSVLGGNQAQVPISIPVNVCGNSAAVLGVAKAHCAGGAHVLNENATGAQTSSGKGSVLGGNQAQVPISAPVNVCGNTAGVAGLAKAGCTGATTVSNVTEEALPSTKRSAVAGKLSGAKDRLVGKVMSKVRSSAPALPSTKRLAAVRDEDTTALQAAETVRGLLRSAGVPVPEDNGPDGPDVRPQLPIKGLPMNIGGTPVLP
ncbi:chaplin [Actinomadura parmotrematis]|uniref:Chaplin n=1 Tax=Actinomadura parmotrematis TaxID=2864039 RepID=A0ABS7FX36_9ACTN|nr:chaplin [Actinomadura parmotrematis]MBW8484735.1 chaplin [Actinomadura parmotrematis]